MDSDNITKNDLIIEDLDKLFKFVLGRNFVSSNKDEIINLIKEIKKENYVNLLKNNLEKIKITVNSKDEVKDKFFNNTKYLEFIEKIDTYNLEELNTIVFCARKSMQLFFNDNEAMSAVRNSWMTLKPKLDLRIDNLTRNPIRQEYGLPIFGEPNELYKYYLGENMDDITRLQNLRSSSNEQMQGGRRNNNRKSNRKQNRKSNRKQNRKSNRKNRRN